MNVQETQAQIYAKETVADYVRLETSDEIVQSVELVSNRSVGPKQYTIWAVATDKNRWWVIEPLTNLYLQSDFSSIDHAFTIHLGITQQISSRQKPSAGVEDIERAPRSWRIWEQAVSAVEHAQEAEDFQAVGLRLRETLTTLIQEIGEPQDDSVRSDIKKADFLAGLDLVASRIAAGRSQQRIRQLLVTTGTSCWHLTNWLTHYKNASLIDAQIALHAVDHFAAQTLMVLVRFERSVPERCPNCGSYRIRRHTLGTSTEDLKHLTICESCDWERQDKTDWAG